MSRGKMKWLKTYQMNRRYFDREETSPAACSILLAQQPPVAMAVVIWSFDYVYLDLLGDQRQYWTPKRVFHADRAQFNVEHDRKRRRRACHCGIRLPNLLA